MNGAGRGKERDREAERQKREGGRGKESALFVIAYLHSLQLLTP